MKASPETYKRTTNLSEVEKGAGSGGDGSYSNANATSGTVTRHSGDMPASPSIEGGGGNRNSPGFEGEIMESDGVIDVRSMEDGIDYTFPGSDQGNLERRGPAVKGT